MDLCRVVSCLPLSVNLSLSSSFSCSFSWYVQNNHKGAVDTTFLPWSISAIQQVIGAVLVIDLWVFKLRPIPELTMANIKIIAPIAVCHTLSNVFIGAGLEGIITHHFVVCLLCVVGGAGGLALHLSTFRVTC